jgi:hypothetical protein
MYGNAGQADPVITSLPATSADEVLYDGLAMEEATRRGCQLRVVARWSYCCCFNGITAFVVEVTSSKPMDANSCAHLSNPNAVVIGGL